jgi:nucleoside-diphosphate-sugar epimerase
MICSEIETEAQLEERLSEPTPEVIELLGRLPGNIVLLGVAGKMGPTLARMARRASDAAGVRRRVIGVSRFSSENRHAFEAHGVETIPCDLLDEDDVARLPDAPNVIFMTGRKFGSTGDEATTWAMNSYLPGVVCRKYRQSRIVAFSTGNVYGLSPVADGGSRETDVPRPVGEYAMSCLGRERIFEYFSRTLDIPLAILRLNYACELRYGVLVDLAERIWREKPVDLSMSYLNTIWQGDANAMTLRALEHVSSPPWVVNMTGPELLSVRSLSLQFGQLLNKPVRFTGQESATALLSNASLGLEKLGTPRIGAARLIPWIAQWVARGGRSLGKPTHFESRDGRF